MDSFFGIGLPELVLILILAGLVMGPHRIREVARTLGRITAQLQRVSREFARQLNSELDAVDSGEMKNTLADMRSLQNEVEALRRELSQVPKTFRDVTDSAAAEGKKAIVEGQKALEVPMVGSSSPADSSNPKVKPEGDNTEGEPEHPPLPKPIDVPGDPET